MAGLDRDLIHIETPEHVVFEYELAGLGSRIFAALLDALFVLLGFAAIALLLLAAGQIAGPWFAALGIVAAFVLFWGYPIYFESTRAGQTPGKRRLGMRVILESGHALTPSVAVVRNLLRIVDFLPGAYALGLAVMILNRRYKRVGDFVAGTIVIRDRPQAAGPRRLTASSLQTVASEDGATALRAAGAHRIPPDRIRLVEEFLQRRLALDPEARRRLARQIAEPLAAQIGAAAPDPERFLKDLLLAHRRDEERAAGPEPPAGATP
jgi:uncharacterized RDD family membrane protein YckC